MYFGLFQIDINTVDNIDIFNIAVIFYHDISVFFFDIQKKVLDQRKKGKKNENPCIKTQQFILSAVSVPQTSHVRRNQDLKCIHIYARSNYECACYIYAQLWNVNDRNLIRGEADC